MAIARKKKKEVKMKTRGGGAGSAVETSPLRPKHVKKTPPCKIGCPQGTNIREFITTLAQTEDAGRTYDESLEKAWYILTEKNPFPSMCGRVCPHPCETECNRGHKDGAVHINSLERFVGDWGIEKNLKLKKDTEEIQKEKVAIVGAGPSGLSCAYHLAKRGYQVTVFEAMPKPGGMVRYGIPYYRMPEDILDAEINRVLDLGVELKCNTRVGVDVDYENLKKEYDAIFVGIGAWKGRNLGLENEDAPNVFSGIDFLARIASGEKVEVGDKVIVIGGGDTAIDAARISRRLGADVTILYRRSRNEMPAIEEEIVGAEEEGVHFHYLAAPKEIKMQDGKAVGMTCLKMELGEPDESGRRRPVPIEGSDFNISCTAIIAAISQEPDFSPLEFLHVGKDWVKVNDVYQTEIEKTYAGGDVVNLGLVTTAIAHGKAAADTIHANLKNIPREEEPELPVIGKDRVLLDWYEPQPRNENIMIPVEERFKDINLEISKGLTQEMAIVESKRCMSCGMCFDCGTCWSYCQDNVIIKPIQKFGEYGWKMEFCKGCKKCSENCPCGYIDMVMPGT